jgi:hypothetical protein
MPGQVIGTVNVQVGNQQGGTVKLTQAPRTLKGSTDLSLAGAAQGDVILYQANTNSFVVAPVDTSLKDIDAGTF